MIITKRHKLVNRKVVRDRSNPIRYSKTVRLLNKLYKFDYKKLWDNMFRQDVMFGMSGCKETSRGVFEPINDEELISIL